MPRVEENVFVMSLLVQVFRSLFIPDLIDSCYRIARFIFATSCRLLTLRLGLCRGLCCSGAIFRIRRLSSHKLVA